MRFGVIWMAAEELILARVQVDQNVYRIIPSKYPTINLFENCLDAADLEAAYELEALTNERLQDEAGNLNMVAPQDRVAGPGSSYIMAAFTHTGIASRFTDGSYGVYYAGLDLETAIAETKHWQALQMRESNEPPFERVMRVFVGGLNTELNDLVDLRGDEAVHDPGSYAHSQRVGKELRESGEYGVIYKSVRHPGGECLAAFRPRLVLPVRQNMHLRYHWNGNEIYHVDEVRDLNA